MSVGETVRFVVTNAGSVEHEFFAGTQAEQAEHAQSMEAGMVGTLTVIP